MTRDITITEGEPDPTNNIEISFLYLDDEWTVAFRRPIDWEQNDLTDWLLDKLDAPKTVPAAIEDDRVRVYDKNHEYKESKIDGFRENVARATYDETTETWTVEILIEDSSMNQSVSRQ